eukprot:gene15600-biopygen23202
MIKQWGIHSLALYNSGTMCTLCCQLPDNTKHPAAFHAARGGARWYNSLLYPCATVHTRGGGPAAVSVCNMVMLKVELRTKMPGRWKDEATHVLGTLNAILWCSGRC